MMLSPKNGTEQPATCSCSASLVPHINWLSGCAAGAFGWNHGAGTVQAQEPDPTDSSLYLPVIRYQTKDCPALKTKTMLGVQTYGATNSGTPYYQSMLDSGAAWVRIETTWQSVEPQNTTPDQFNWSEIDALADVVNDGCMNVVFTHGGQPRPWAATSPRGCLTSTKPH